MCSAAAVRDISDESSTTCLSAFAISSAASSNSGVSPSRADTVGSHCAAAAVDMSDNQTTVDVNADKTAVMTAVTAASENSAADGMASCSITDMNPVKSSLLPTVSDDEDKYSEFVDCVLCLLHALSHCSYHEPSLLVLAEHAFHDAAVDLFVYLWHKLRSSQQQDDRLQARVFASHVHWIK